MGNKISSKSIGILEAKVLNYFRENNKEISIFCDNCDLIWGKSNVINVLLMGTALRDLLSVDMWPNKKFVLWVLNETQKRNISNLLNIPLNSIGVINRYNLFTLKNGVPFPELSKNISFLFASRAMTLKNFNIAYEYVSYLANKYQCIFDFKICAPNFKKSDFISKIKVKNNVSLNFLGDLGPEWFRNDQIVGDEIMLQFSLDPFDDFNVSAAQWQEYGGSIICVDGGPFAELIGENVRFIHKDKVWKVFNEGFDYIKEFELYKKNIVDSKESLAITPICKEQICNIIKSIPLKMRDDLFLLNGYEMRDLTKRILNG